MKSRLGLILRGCSQVLIVNFAAGTGKHAEKEENFCQSHSLEVVHRGLKGIMKVRGLKVKFKKYSKIINHKIVYSHRRNNSISIFLFSIPPAFANIFCCGWNAEDCVMACQEASQKYIHQPRDSMRLHYI